MPALTDGYATSVDGLIMGTVITTIGAKKKLQERPHSPTYQSAKSSKARWASRPHDGLGQIRCVSAHILRQDNGRDIKLAKARTASGDIALSIWLDANEVIGFVRLKQGRQR